MLLTRIISKSVGPRLKTSALSTKLILECHGRWLWTALRSACSGGSPGPVVKMEKDVLGYPPDGALSHLPEHCVPRSLKRAAPARETPS